MNIAGAIHCRIVLSVSSADSSPLHKVVAHIQLTFHVPLPTVDTMSRTPGGTVCADHRMLASAKQNARLGVHAYDTLAAGVNEARQIDEPGDFAQGTHESGQSGDAVCRARRVYHTGALASSLPAVVAMMRCRRVGPREVAARYGARIVDSFRRVDTGPQPSNQVEFAALLHAMSIRTARSAAVRGCNVRGWKATPPHATRRWHVCDS